MRKLIVILGCVSAGWIQAADVYVATNGVDAGSSSSIGSPFATISYAASKMSAGDTCYIRGGSYHDEVVLSGKNNLTFKAYSGEQVTMDGTVEISTPWTLYSGSIYKTTLSQNIWQLFADHQMMMPARWPNAALADSTVWDQPNHWAKLVYSASELSAMVDAPTGHSDLAGLGFSVSNAVAILNVGSFKSYARQVAGHAAGSASFSLSSPVGNRKSSNNQFYFLEGKLEFLDADSEWYYDPATKDLYFWGNTNAMIRGKVQDYAFQFTNCDDITISGIDFFATTVYFSGCNRAQVEKGDFDHPSFTKRMLGVQAVGPAVTWFNGGGGNVFFDNTMRYADTEAIYMNGTGNRIENCLFEFIDWSCADLPSLMGTVYMRGATPVFRGNTAHTTGASEFLDVNDNPVVDLNRIEHIGLVQNDGAAVQLTVGTQPGSIVAYNWFLNSEKYGARFDASTALGSPTGSDGLMHHNVGFGVKSALMQKGDRHACYNNTSLDSLNNGIIILADAVSASANTVVRNNAAEKLSSARTGNVALALVTIHDHNWNGYEQGNADLRMLLRDPDNLDFRPIPNSVLVDSGTNIAAITVDSIGAAPDIGAYESGTVSYWIAGRKETGASAAIPPDGSTTVKASASLIWNPGLDAVSNGVYWGSASNAVAAATPTDPEYRGAQIGNIFDPLGLQAQTYWWRIDTFTATGTVKGTVWTFTVPTATPAAPGIINHLPEVNITNFSAVVGGEITDGGTGSRVMLHLWPDGGPTNMVDMGVQAGSFATNITGIAINTQYHVRCYATNSYGSASTPTIETFVIGLLPEAPQVVNAMATNITTSGALIGGTITNETLANDVWIHIWPDGGATNEVVLGTQLAGFSTNLSGLADNTLYHYQCAAGNSYGTNQASSVESFMTLQIGTTNWIELAFDNFETGWGNYTNGGANAVLYTGGTPRALGSNAAQISFNGDGASFWLTSGIDVDTPRYPALKLEFSLYFVGMDNLDYFYVDFWDGATWQQVGSFNKNDYGGNNVRKAITLLIDESSYSFTTNMNIRFRGGANNATDLTYIDDVRVSAMEPLTTLYGEWLSGYGLTETNLLVDSDSDGMNNLVEYALGGNPSLIDASTVLPTSSMNAGSLKYVYQRRTDAAMRKLNYQVELATNLQQVVWSQNGFSEIATQDLGTGFESVTNQIQATVTTRFVRLRITKE